VKGRPKDPRRAKRGTGHRAKPGQPTRAALVALPPPAPDLLEPPEDLREDMQAVWRRMVGALRISAPLREVDVFALEAAVRLYVRMRENGKLVDDYGVLARTDAGVTVSPFVKGERDAALGFLRFAEQYGLTLASRMRLGLMQLQGKSLLEGLAEDLEKP
jgi:P27 family predicted phage terminase small subunit